MKCGEVYSSIQAWRKLSGIPLVPKIGLAILRYTKLVTAEYDVIEKQRVSEIREVAGAKEGENVEIKPDTPAHIECIKKINALMGAESDLSPVGVDLEVVIDALEGKENVLSVSDLAVLEPFFSVGDAQ